ncbi:homocysteine S-methyltransferase family protein [Arthrobacter sp. UYCu512]|uniref:homocysteine S-methyltransferase family protein n=1 Tax=Arthrobacter sp. UYCu512 TaxID=3156338 RepID=UPI0033984F0B
MRANATTRSPKPGGRQRVPAGPGSKPPAGLAEGTSIWRELGARLIGGCCRTTPRDIAAVADLSRSTRTEEVPGRKLPAARNTPCRSGTANTTPARCTAQNYGSCAVQPPI